MVLLACDSHSQRVTQVGVPGWITTLQVQADWLFTGSADGALMQWDAHTGDNTLAWNLPDWIMSLAVGSSVLWCGLQADNEQSTSMMRIDRETKQVQLPSNLQDSSRIHQCITSESDYIS